MRKFLLSAAALALLAVPALGDPPADRGNRGHGEGRGHERAEQNQAAAPQAQAPQDRGERGRGFGRDQGNRGPAPQMAAPQMAAPQMAAPQNREGDRNFNRADRGETREFNRGDRGQMVLQAPQNRGDQPREFNRGDGRDFGNRNAFNDNRDRGDFRRDRNFRSPGFGGGRRDFRSFRDFHRDFRAPHRFRVRAYQRPSGWYSHRWAFGEFLPAAFWGRQYWLIDFDDYDLPPPPYGAVWVRVDRDALLVDDESGEIITVVYDVFY